MTFSIIARDDRTRRFGVAVSSCVLAVGTRVPAARAGVGAVVVQAAGELPWRGALLDLLDRGLRPADAIAALGAAVDLDATQVAAVSGTGSAAAFTGAGCDGFAGDVASGPVVAQANTMARDGVWTAMLDAFHRADDLVDGMLAALRAAEARGGDLRGRQSAALVVVPAEGGVEPIGSADDPFVDLRVDDSRDPVGELARLVRVGRAHRRLIRASTLSDPEAALDEARQAAAEAPDDPLCGPAAGIALGLAGAIDEAVALIEQAVTVNPAAMRWARQRAHLAADGGSSAAALFLTELDRVRCEDT